MTNAAEQVDAADNACASQRHAARNPLHIIWCIDKSFRLSWLSVGERRKRHAVARLGVTADLRRSLTFGMADMDNKKIADAIYNALTEATDLKPDVISDIAFHMTDWLDGLESFHQFCQDPDQLSSAQIEKLLIDFLIHVPNHVAAAGKLLNDIPVSDIFAVGATTESE
jgi:hypothetical protein